MDTGGNLSKYFNEMSHKTIAKFKVKTPKKKNSSKFRSAIFIRPLSQATFDKEKFNENLHHSIK